MGPTEIGYLFGQYKRIAGVWNAALTGKGCAAQRSLPAHASLRALSGRLPNRSPLLPAICQQSAHSSSCVLCVACRLGFGGSFIRPEATGYGVVFFAEAALKDRDDDLKDKRCVVSGSG